MSDQAKYVVSEPVMRALGEMEGWANLGAVDEALRVYRELPEDVCETPPIIEGITSLLYRYRRYDECLLHAAVGMFLYRDVWLYWFIASSCLGQMGRVDARRELLKAAAENCPQDVEEIRAVAAEN